MADWFETRFREPVDVDRLDPAFAARMRALVVKEWQADAGWTPSENTDPDDQEGDIIMLETEDHPTGNEPTTPRRRPPGQWLLVAAAVAVVAVVGALLVASAGGDDEDKIDTVTTAPTQRIFIDIMQMEGFADIQPGFYAIDPDGDPSTPLQVTYEVPDGWSQWIGAAKFTDTGHTGLAITTITNLVRDACLDHAPQDPAVGPTVDDLATALTQLAPFEVTSPPSDVTILGYPGKHLQLTVPQLAMRPARPLPNGQSGLADCTDGELKSWIAPNLGGPFHGYNGEPGRTEDFWILDVNGTRLVLETTYSPDTPPEDLVERDAIFDSIEIHP